MNSFSLGDIVELPNNAYGVVKAIVVDKALDGITIYKVEYLRHDVDKKDFVYSWYRDFDLVLIRGTKINSSVTETNSTISITLSKGDSIVVKYT